VIKPGTDLQSILMKHPDFSDFTYRKNGSVKSFAYGSERVRLTTLHGFMVDLLDDLAPPMIAPPTPALPVPAPASPLSPAAPPLPQPESPLDQFVRIGQRVRPAQQPTKPGVNTPGSTHK
jgi:hypothetical protein